MDQDNKTRRRVYLWILFAVIVFFPLYWMLQPSVTSPYSTAMQVTEREPAIESLHPLAPNRLERFGTDPLGRHITTLIARSLPQAMAMAAVAGLMRAVLGALFTKLRLRPRVPFWVWIPVEIILYGFVFSLPFFRIGLPQDHLPLLTGLLGLFFFPAQTEDTSLRKIGLNAMDQFVRILLLLTVLGLLGRNIGSNPYAAIPTSFGPVNFTYPFLTNLFASLWVTGSAAWWTWMIPLIAVFAVILAVILVRTPMLQTYERRGVYFTNLTQDFLDFLNPVTAVKEIIHFGHHVAKNSLRIALLLILLVFLTWGARGTDHGEYQPVYGSFEETREELQGITSTEDRIAYAADLVANSQVNPSGDDYVIPIGDNTLVAGTRPGVSRVQPLILLFHVDTDETTFALQVALFKSVLDNAQNIWLQQSLVFGFTDTVDADFRSLLDISGNGFFASLGSLYGEPVLIDETLVYPGNSWAGQIAEDFRTGFDNHGIEHELTWLQPQSQLALKLSEKGLLGVQVRGGHDEDPQQTLNALTDAIMRYGTRERQYR